MQEAATDRQQRSSALVETELEAQVELRSSRQALVRRTRIEYLWPVLLLFVVIGSIGFVHVSRRGLDEEDRTNLQRQERSLDGVYNVYGGESKQRLRRHAPMQNKHQKRGSLSGTGYIDVRFNAPKRVGGRKYRETLRFPVACYEQKHFPLSGEFVNYMPWLPIFVDQKTRQTIIYSTEEVHLLPSMVDIYGKRYSVAELLSTGHAQFVGCENLLTDFFDINFIFYPSSSTRQRGVPKMAISKVGFAGCLHTDFDFLDAVTEPKLIVSEAESKEEDDPDLNHDIPEYVRLPHGGRHRPRQNQSSTTATNTTTSRYKVFYTTPRNTECASRRPRTVYYKLIIEETFPYSQSRKAVLSVNGSFPGPPLDACEGDTYLMDVCNRMNVPSTIHWHGMRQIGTPDMDGAVGVTQCAIPPGYTHRYKFKANPSGTFWYHGHFLEQIVDGMVGPMHVYPRVDPHAGLYEREITLMISDWYDKAAHAKLVPWLISGNNINAVEPAPDAIVCNGQFTQSLLYSLNGTRRFKIRIINAAASGYYRFSIDGLPLKIVEIDSTLTKPYTVDSFKINVAQRMSCIVDLDDLHPNYIRNGVPSTKALFFRFFSFNSIIPVDLAYFIPPNERQRYAFPVMYNLEYQGVFCFDSSNSTPSYQIGSPTPVLNVTYNRNDSNYLDARPIYRNDPSFAKATHCLKLNVSFQFDSDGKVRPRMNNKTYSSDANYMHMRDNPTTGFTKDTYAPLLHQMVEKPDQLNIPEPIMTDQCDKPMIQSDGECHYYVPYGSVVDINVTNINGGIHPMHLHSNFFSVICSSENPNTEAKYAGRYIQRDTVNLPSSGWVVIRFVADNPGAWFFHCHIEWHMTEGLAIAFAVAPDQLIKNGFTISKSERDMCEALQRYNIKINETDV